MSFTLRTLLAFLDNAPLPTEEREPIQRALDQNPAAQELVHRIRTLMAQPRMASPAVETAGVLQANQVAEYLDGTSEFDVTKKFEQTCLKNDAALSEIAALHQILTDWIDQPTYISDELRQRIYQFAGSWAETPDIDSDTPRSVGREAIQAAANLLQVRELDRPVDPIAANPSNSTEFTKITTTDSLPSSIRQAVSSAIAANQATPAKPVVQATKVSTSATSSNATSEESGQGSWILALLVLVGVGFLWWSQQNPTPMAGLALHQSTVDQVDVLKGTDQALPSASAQLQLPALPSRSPSEDALALPSPSSTTLPPIQLSAGPTLPPISLGSSERSLPTTGDAATDSLNMGAHAIPTLPTPVLELPQSSSPVEPNLIPGFAEPESIASNLSAPTTSNSDGNSEQAVRPHDGNVDAFPLAEIKPTDPLAPRTTSTLPNTALPNTTLPNTTLPSDTSALPSETATLPTNPAALPANLSPLPSNVATLPTNPSTLPTNSTALPPAAVSPSAPIISALPPVDEEGDTSPLTLEQTANAPHEASSMVSNPLVPARAGTAPSSTLPEIDTSTIDPALGVTATSEPTTSALLPAVTTPLVAAPPADPSSSSNLTPLEWGLQVGTVVMEGPVGEPQDDWILVLPGGRSQLKVRSPRGKSWNFTFSGVSRYQLQEKPDLPQLSVQRCFLLLQCTSQDETLEIQTPKGKMFVTALTPEAELIFEIRPFLPQGYSAANTAPRYYLGCLGLSGRVMVEHQDREVVLFANKWLVVEPDGHQKIFEKEFPAGIAATIEELKSAQVNPDVSALSGLVQSSEGMDELFSIANGNHVHAPQITPDQRSLAALWGYGLGQLEPAFTVLNDPSLENYWDIHIQAIASCLQSDPSASGQLATAAQRFGFTSPIDTRFVGIDPQTIKLSQVNELIVDLEHAQVARRVLALHSLKLLTNETYGYDPTASTDLNRTAIASWKQWLADSAKSRISINPTNTLVPSVDRQ